MIKETPEMTETVVEQAFVEKPAVTPVPAASDEQLVAMLVDRARSEGQGVRSTHSRSAGRFALARTPSIFAAVNSGPGRAVRPFACIPSTPSPDSPHNSSTSFRYYGDSDAAVIPSRHSGTPDRATGASPTTIAGGVGR